MTEAIHIYYAGLENISVKEVSLYSGILLTSGALLWIVQKAKFVREQARVLELKNDELEGEIERKSPKEDDNRDTGSSIKVTI